MSETKQNVAILGASQKRERFSNKAARKLKTHGHALYLVNPGLSEIEGEKVFPNLSAIDQPIDTLTMYIGAELSTKIKDDIINLAPKRIIFNPGSENPELYPDLEQAGIEIVEDCTLVMLSNQSF